MVVGEFTTETDLLVIGGGPGGHAAAVRAAELGIETTIVDQREQLGGGWLHEGSISSKELVRIASIIRSASGLQSAGVRFDSPGVDLERVRAHIDHIVAAQAAELAATLDERGVAVVRGQAHFENSRQVSIRNSSVTPRIRFRRALVATGAGEIALPEAEIGSTRVMSARAAIALPDIAESLLIVGGGSSAIEIGCIYAALGSRVTLATDTDQLLPNADADLVEVMTRHLRAMMDAIEFQSRISSVQDVGDHLEVEFSSPNGARTQRFDRMIVSIGRRPATDSLDLRRTKVTCGRGGFIEVDDQLRTRDPRIFAVGDVTGEPMLAMKAAQQGRIAAEVIAGWIVTFDIRAAPMVLHSDPQLAWTGLTEAQATTDHVPCLVQRVAFDHNHVRCDPERACSLTKVIYDPDAKVILGAGAVGPGAMELISEATLAIEMGAVLSDLVAIIHPHPSRCDDLNAAARHDI